MTSIDELFKGAGSSSGKRKLDPIRDPSQVYKSARLENGDDRHARVEDEDDIEAGPAPPPDDEDGDYGPTLPPEDEEGDDEEGRFFGSGITSDQREILDYVDGVELPAEQKIDVPWLRKTALGFEKLVSKNAEQRARFADDPAKFIQSEADLDGEIKRLSILTENPQLYPEFARLGCAGTLVSLLAHENSDISVDVLEILNELTDNDDVDASQEQWDSLVDAALEADLLGLVGSNLERLDEKEEVDRNGVYYALGVLENLASRRTTAAEAIGSTEHLVKWLLARIQAKEKRMSQNKQYAAEILAILVQASPKNRRKLAELDAADIMLQLLASYRKRDPEKGGEEEEYMENLFEALTCLVDEVEGKAKFTEAEGVELGLIMLKEGKMSKGPALRLLDHATGGPTGAEVCQKIVEAAGLKTIFTMFMKKNDNQTLEHLIGIFASMLRLLPGNSAERIRTLAKFVEKDYEKTAKLVQLRRQFAARVERADAEIRAEQAQLKTAEEREEYAADWFSRRLDAGLFQLQTTDVVLAWLVAEDDGARKKITALLAERDETLRTIRASIEEQIEGVDEVEDADGKDTKEMLSTLAQFLQ
ncbi:Catenin-beta-like protein [Apiospora arundinis]